jgi:hypothetical protein
VDDETKQAGERGSDSSGWSNFSTKPTEEEGLVSSLVATVNNSRGADFACELSSMMFNPSEEFLETLTLGGRSPGVLPGEWAGWNGLFSPSAMTLV